MDDKYKNCASLKKWVKTIWKPGVGSIRFYLPHPRSLSWRRGRHWAFWIAALYNPIKKAPVEYERRFAMYKPLN